MNIAWNKRLEVSKAKKFFSLPVFIRENELRMEQGNRSGELEDEGNVLRSEGRGTDMEKVN